MNLHQPSIRAPYSRPRLKPKLPISIFGFSIREIFLILVIAFPCLGTLFPLDTYLGSAGGFVAKTPLNTTIVLTLILGYVFWLFGQNISKAVFALRRNWVILLFIFWAMCTARWAWNPGLSFNRSGRLLVFALYAVYLAEFMPVKRATQLLLIALSISVAVSLLLIVGAPSVSLMADDLRGAWRGAMAHKNGLGFTAGIAVAASLLGFYMNLLDRRLCLGVTFASLVVLKLANSATALFSMVVVVGFMGFVLLIVNRTRRPLFTLLAGLALPALLTPIVLSSGIVFELLNRDATLTGRADIWAFVHTMIDANPFWGYGHGIWANVDFRRLIYETIAWPAPHAHNAWLDFRLQLGLPGFILAITIWTVSTINLLWAIQMRRFHVVVLPAIIFAFASIRSYSETIICDPGLNDMFWIAYAYAAFARTASELRLSRRAKRRGYGDVRTGIAAVANSQVRQPVTVVPRLG